MAETVQVTAKADPRQHTESYWDGHLIQLIGWTILGAILVTITLGIMYPWYYCVLQRWKCKHSVYDGYRLVFDGHAIQIIGKWICWLLLTVVTLTIFAWFIPMKIEKWKASHTHLVVDVKR